LLDKIDGTIASFTGDGAYDQDRLCGKIAAPPSRCRSRCRNNHKKM